MDGGWTMITVQCLTPTCMNYLVGIDVLDDVDASVYCGVCGAEIFPTDYDPENVEVPPWLI